MISIAFDVIKLIILIIIESNEQKSFEAMPDNQIETNSTN